MILKATAFFNAFHKHPEGLAAAKTKVIRSVILLMYVNFCQLLSVLYGSVNAFCVTMKEHLLTAQNTEYIEGASVTFYMWWTCTVHQILHHVFMCCGV